MLLSKKEQAKQWLIMHQNHIHFSCIYCHQELRLDGNSLICGNNHCFDLSKQGYVFLAKNPSESHYHRNLFELRRQIIQVSPFYRTLHQALETIIKVCKPQVLIDAGSGEGSHLNVCKQWVEPDASLIGLDLSKEGIILSTDYNQEQFNIVADLSELPLKDSSVDMILSILSPANYHEFNRVLKPLGLLIKVVPNKSYLLEIRRGLSRLGLVSESNYDNTDIIQTFAKHYPDYQEIIIKDQVPLSPYYRSCLAQMTPLTWNLSAEDLERLIQELPETITLDLTLLISHPITE